MTNNVPFEEDESRPRVETLAIAEITRDEEIAARDIDPDVVAEYQERMAAGDEFPPLQVMRDASGVNWLWDGWHRLEAATRNRVESIDCTVRKGDRRAALLASAGANATHGLRRSAEDKRRAVLKLLTDAEWAKWSDHEIARQCRVSPTFVGEVRRLTVHADSERRPRQFRTKHGNVSTMNTADIGAKQGTNVRYLPSTEKVSNQEIKTVAYVRETQARHPTSTPSPRCSPSLTATRCRRSSGSPETPATLGTKRLCVA